MSALENFPSHKRRAKTPSFSSILLDSIYRSFDNTPTTTESSYYPSRPHTDIFSPTKHIYNNNNNNNNTNYARYRRTKMRSDSTLALNTVDSWLDNKHHHLNNSQSQPSDLHQHHNHYDHNNISIVRQKAVPAASSPPSAHNHHHTNPPSKRVVSSSRLFTKTKSRALKLYGDLKKPKQRSPPPPQPPSRSPPLSPGGKIASFLNAIFRTSSRESNNQPSTSTSSSSSSFSKSCLSKKSSTTGNKTKRSVRFYPVSFILNEDSKKSLHKEDAIVELDGNRRKFKREKEIDTLMMMMIKRDCIGCEDSDEKMNNEDGESCASSDLFELENLNCIGISRFSEELPVYGTTSLHKLTA